MKYCELELAVRYYESITRKKHTAEEQEKRFNEYKCYVEELKHKNEPYNEKLFKDLTTLRKLNKHSIDKKLN